MMQLQTTTARTPLRWSLSVDAETDAALRSFLAEQGARKGDLSKFVERAVHRDLFLRTLDEVHAQNANESEQSLSALVAQEWAAHRAESASARQ